MLTIDAPISPRLRRWLYDAGIRIAPGGGLFVPGRSLTDADRREAIALIAADAAEPESTSERPDR